MKLPKLTVNRPITTAMVFIAVFLFGMIALSSLPTDLLPDVELPTLTVITVYPGASAHEVEQQVTKPLEAVLSGTQGMKHIKSQSKDNVSIVSLEFEWGEDISDATNNVRDLMELVKTRLPNDAYSPMIYKINSSMIPVVAFGIQADESYNGIEKIIEDKIASPIRKVTGVGTVISLGEPEREIKIQINPHQLSAYGLTVAQVSQVLKLENITIPAGNIKIGKLDFSVRVPGDFTCIDDIRNTAITAINNQVIRLKDVAEVSDTFRDKDEFATVFDKQSVAFFVQKQSGANTLEVYNAVVREMDKIRATLPPDVKVIEVMNGAELIMESIKSLSSSIYFAGLFVVLVVFFFLRQWRSSLIVILTIPFSLITSFIFMKLLGYTINIFSLMSLAIAIGMVVDNAIVVLENIMQHLEKGARPKEAAIFAASEMGTAITASTLTTIAVFFPMYFIGGIIGVLFKQLAVLTSITMLASLITALSLTPMVASRLLKTPSQQKTHSKLFNWSEQLFIRVENWYKRALARILKYRKTVLALSIILFATTAYVAYTLGTDYIPNVDSSDVAAVIEIEVGCSVAETRRVAAQVEQIFKEEIPEATIRFSIVGQTESGALSTIGFAEGKNIASVMAHLTLPNHRKRGAKEIADKVYDRIEAIPEIEHFHVTGGSMMVSALLGNVKPIVVKLSGDDLDLLTSTADELAQRMKTISELNNVETTADEGKLEIQINIDKQKASMLGLNTAMIALQLRQSIYGADAGTYQEEGEDYDITVQLDPIYNSDFDDLKNIQIRTLTGQHIPLSEVATLTKGIGQSVIKRESQERYVTVAAELNNVSLGVAANTVEKMLANYDTPQGVDIKLSGQTDDQNESFSRLTTMLFIGILLVYMVMAAQFESFKDPLIIFLALPFSLIGVIWALKVTGFTISVVTFTAIIMLIGIVVNNGIVLVDYTNLLRARGYKLLDAAAEAGRSRLRPVMMTSFTTILGMLPLALSHGMGSEFWQPLGITIIGGLLISTLITLLLVPVLYTLFNLRTLKNEKDLSMDMKGGK